MATSPEGIGLLGDLFFLYLANALNIISYINILILHLIAFLTLSSVRGQTHGEAWTFYLKYNMLPPTLLSSQC